MALRQAPGPVRIVIADDDPLFGRMVQAHLSHRADLEVVGLAADGREAITLTEELEPDLVLLDVSMPVLDGVAAAQVIRAAASPPVIVLVTDADGAPGAHAHGTGAAAYLRKTDDVVPLMHIVLTMSQLGLAAR